MLHENKKFKCPYCELKAFKKKRQLKAHLKDSHPDRLQKCICTFTQKTVGDGCSYCSKESREKYENDLQ